MKPHDRLVLLMKAKNIKVKDVKDHVGVSDTAVRSWINGEVLPTRGHHLTALAWLLDTTESYIAFGTEDVEPVTCVTSDAIFSQVKLLTDKQRVLVKNLIECILEPETNSKWVREGNGN